MPQKNQKYKIPRRYENVGGYLKKMRVRAGFTQKQVSDELGYSSAQFISNFERGIALPPLNKLKILIRMYEIKSQTLIDLIVECQRLEISRGLKIKV